ncbi:MAG: HD domain-containing protein [Moheibacter sp.]
MNLEKAVNHKVFELIGNAASELNQQTFVVGGYVRDFLLKIGQKKDIDFVTVGSGIELAKKAHSKMKDATKLTVYKRFGTAMFKWQGIELEFVGARKESYSEDSRKPFVEDGTLDDDQKRRDFTINALAISVNSENFGQLVDPFDGIGDLKNKIIRTPLDPDVTFSDDPLRMMRAIRFAAQLGFEIEKNSFDSILKNSKRIEIVSKERVMDEFQKIMMTDKPSIGLKLLDDAGLMIFILPELIALKGIEEIEGQTHKDNFYHTLEVVDNISENTDNLWLRWSALLHDIGKAPTKRYDKKIGWTFHTHEFVGSKMVYTLFKRLKLPMGQPMKYVQKIVMLSSRPIALIDENVTDSALRRLLYDAGDDFEDLFVLCKADITTKNEKKQHQFKKNFILVEQKIREVEERDRIRNFQPPVSGEEIMNIFGLVPGKEIGIIKNAIKEAILEGEIKNDRESALNYMFELGKKLYLTPKLKRSDL